jgi:hypothetical protein
MKHFIVDAVRREIDGTISDWLQVGIVCTDRPTAVQDAMDRITKCGYDVRKYDFSVQRIVEMEG